MKQEFTQKILRVLGVKINGKTTSSIERTVQIAGETIHRSVNKLQTEVKTRKSGRQRMEFR